MHRLIDLVDEQTEGLPGAAQRRRDRFVLGNEAELAVHDEEDHVGGLDRRAAGRDAAIRADHAQRQSVGFGNGALSRNRGGDGQIQQFGQPCQRREGALPGPLQHPLSAHL